MKYHKKYSDELVTVIQRISRDTVLLNDFLIDILSPAEYKEISVRWQIVKQLEKGIPQRQVAKNLGVSIATITRGSRELLDEKGGFKKVLKKLYLKK